MHLQEEGEDQVLVLGPLCIIRWHQALANGVSGRLGAVHHVKFAEDVADVGLDRLVTDAQIEGDLSVGAPPGHEGQHLDLARCQCGQGGRFRADGGEFVQHLAGDFGVGQTPRRLDLLGGQLPRLTGMIRQFGPPMPLANSPKSRL